MHPRAFAALVWHKPKGSGWKPKGHEWKPKGQKSYWQNHSTPECDMFTFAVICNYCSHEPNGRSKPNGQSKPTGQSIYLEIGLVAYRDLTSGKLRLLYRMIRKDSFYWINDECEDNNGTSSFRRHLLRIGVLHVLVIYAIANLECHRVPKTLTISLPRLWFTRRGLTWKVVWQSIRTELFR